MDASGADLGSVTLAGDVRLVINVLNVLIDTEQGDNAAGGDIMLASAVVSADALGQDLTLNSATTLAGATSGAVTLGTFSNAAGQFVNILTIDVTRGLAGAFDALNATWQHFPGPRWSGRRRRFHFHRRWQCEGGRQHYNRYRARRQQRRRQYPIGCGHDLRRGGKSTIVVGERAALPTAGTLTLEQLAMGAVNSLERSTLSPTARALTLDNDINVQNLAPLLPATVAGVTVEANVLPINANITVTGPGNIIANALQNNLAAITRSPESC